MGSQKCADEGLALAWQTCEPLTCSGAHGTCVGGSGQTGEFACTNGLAASACAGVGNCSPGDSNACQLCDIVNGYWTWEDDSSCNWTPLVLAFDGQPVDFTRARGDFDLAGREASFDTDWVSAATPWLAMDLDGDGRIGDGRELFGSMTVLPSGERARNGFEALRALDEDGDGALTPHDTAFQRLLVWRDVDQDRRSEPDELVPAADAGVLAIRLDDQAVPRCSGGDCEVERASFTFRDRHDVAREGAIVDVHLARR